MTQKQQQKHVVADVMATIQVLILFILAEFTLVKGLLINAFAKNLCLMITFLS